MCSLLAFYLCNVTNRTVISGFIIFICVLFWDIIRRHTGTVWVGTPPQRKTVIVDTGSHYTAFPCTGCTKCGEEHHTDKYFDPEKSSSFHANSCSNNECEASSSKSCKSEDHCTFGQSYAEGSSWKAYEARDLYSVGGNTPADGSNAIHGAFAIDFMFGCQYSENGLFITQLADGIMGMSGQGKVILCSFYTHVWLLCTCL